MAKYNILLRKEEEMKETSTTHDIFVVLPHPEELLCLTIQKTTHKVEIFLFYFFFYLKDMLAFQTTF